ncbi:hypothetical protein ACIHFE_11135 [Streptomyces sp. NPDC052396]|uniref:hypothetical protein n=1 Tax=Streptomyces sp. NPDC052396 TaxID=3365689 RepID=UPI0037CFB1EB
MPWRGIRGRHRLRRPGRRALALLAGALWCGAACWPLWAAGGRDGAVGGLVLAGWGLSLLPVHCVPRPRRGEGRFGGHRLTRSG